MLNIKQSGSMLGSLFIEPGHLCGFDHRFIITATWKGEPKNTLITFYRYRKQGYERLLCLSFPFVIVPGEAKFLADEAWNAYCERILKGGGQRLYVGEDEQRPLLDRFEQRMPKIFAKECWWKKPIQISYCSVLIVLGGLQLLFGGHFLFFFKLAATAAILQRLFLLGGQFKRVKTTRSFQGTFKQACRLLFNVNSFSLLLIAWLSEDLWALWLVVIMLIVHASTVIPLNKAPQ